MTGIAVATAVCPSTPGATGDDRAEVSSLDDALLLVVVDGAGGVGGGSLAADAVVAEVRRSAGDAAPNLVAVLETADRQLARLGVEAAAVVARIEGRRISGASAGDCGAWLIRDGRHRNLTEHQSRKPLLGAGAVIAPFGGALDGTLLVATDGLLKYAAAGRICSVAERADIDSVPSQLVDLVRLRSGTLQDDIGIICVRQVR